MWVRRLLAFAEQQKQQENFAFVCYFKNVPRPIHPRLHSGAHCACVCYKCRRDKKMWVRRLLAFAEQQKQQENFAFVCYFKNVPRPIHPRLHSGAHCACVCYFPCTFVMLMFMLVLMLMSQCKPGLTLISIFSV